MGEAIILVCGFGRCGSSLTMQMLSAGGLGVAGEAPSFEPDELRPRAEMRNRIDATWLDAQRGRAVKLLDPQRYILPPGNYRAIWLSRDAIEQARSQAKFAYMLLGLPRSRGQVRALARSYRSDRPRAIATLRVAGAEIFEVAFEALVGSGRRETARALAEFIGADLDIDRMAAAVLPRGLECQPGLDIELALIRRAERAA